MRFIDPSFSGFRRRHADNSFVFHAACPAASGHRIAIIMHSSDHNSMEVSQGSRSIARRDHQGCRGPRTGHGLDMDWTWADAPLSRAAPDPLSRLQLPNSAVENMPRQTASKSIFVDVISLEASAGLLLLVSRHARRELQRDSLRLQSPPSGRCPQAQRQGSRERSEVCQRASRTTQGLAPSRL